MLEGELSLVTPFAGRIMELILPLKIWRKVHTLPCKSLACSSWAGGCIEKSYITTNKNVSQWRICKSAIGLHKCLNVGKHIYKWREDLFCCPTRYREATMGACITGSQSFTEEFCLRPIWFLSKIWCQKCFLVILQIKFIEKMPQVRYLSVPQHASAGICWMSRLCWKDWMLSVPFTCTKLKVVQREELLSWGTTQKRQ